MAGAFTIQRVPRGLLYALAMKGLGQTPTELAGAILGTFDTTALYLGDALRSKTDTSPIFNTDSNNDFTGFIVPAGEIWIPMNFSLERSGVAAGTSFEMSGFFARGQSGFPQFCTGKVSIVGGGAATSDGTCYGTWGLFELVMYPNDRFGVAVRNGTWGAAQQATGCLDYYRLEI